MVTIIDEVKELVQIQKKKTKTIRDEVALFLSAYSPVGRKGIALDFDVEVEDGISVFKVADAIIDVRPELSGQQIISQWLHMDFEELYNLNRST